MATNHTANYGLHVWEPTDDFLREEFHEDFGKLDGAIVIGSYTGDNATMKENALGFHPKAVLLADKYGRIQYQELRKRVAEIFRAASKRYGSRRIYVSLRNEGITVSEKVVRRIMREGNLVVPFVKMRKYSSYVGEVTPAVTRP